MQQPLKPNPLPLPPPPPPPPPPPHTHTHTHTHNHHTNNYLPCSCAHIICQSSLHVETLPPYLRVLRREPLGWKLWRVIIHGGTTDNSGGEGEGDTSHSSGATTEECDNQFFEILTQLLNPSMFPDITSVVIQEDLEYDHHHSVVVRILRLLHGSNVTSLGPIDVTWADKQRGWGGDRESRTLRCGGAFVSA